MASWKKVVVSGSSAALKEITNDPGVATATHLASTRLTGSFSGSFSGNGAGLTGVTGEIDIDGLDPGTVIVASDKLVYSDNGIEKSITYGIVSASIYSGVYGDIAIGEGGNSSIESDKITLAMLKRATTGSILNTIAGDVNVSTGGVSSIESDKITLAMLKRATTGSILNTIVGDVNVSTGGASTIQADSVKATMINSDVAGTGLTQGTDGALSMSINTLLSDTTIDVANDSFAYNDANDNNTRQDTFADLATAQAGKGLAASSGVFNVETTADSGLAFTGVGAAGTLGLDLDGTSGNDTLQMDSNGLSLKSTIPGNRTFSGGVTISGDLNVAGTASFNHSKNLSVVDKYILLNSGSAGANLDSGGIVIGGPNDNGKGELFGFISGSTESTNGINRRWAVVADFDADSAGDFTAEAFMSTVTLSSVLGNTNPDNVSTKYKKAGNIFVDQTTDSEEIYIYA